MWWCCLIRGVLTVSVYIWKKKKNAVWRRITDVGKDLDEGSLNDQRFQKSMWTRIIGTKFERQEGQSVDLSFDPCFVVFSNLGTEWDKITQWNAVINRTVPMLHLHFWYNNYILASNINWYQFGSDILLMIHAFVAVWSVRKAAKSDSE